MALTPEQIVVVRRMVSEPTADNGWTDEDIAALAELNVNEDGSYDLRALAAQIWEMKAASYVSLARVSESGSSRDLQQIFDHAKLMADYFKNPQTNEATPVFPRSTKMVRPTRS